MRKGLATGLGRPSLFQRKDRLTIQIGLEAGFGRYRQAHRPLGRQDVIFAVKEADRAGDIVGHMATFSIANDPRPDANIGLGPRKDLGRLGQGLAALETLDGVGIARLCDIARRPFAANQQGVLINPSGLLFACGQVETTGDKALGLGIELAHLDGVLAAIGQGHEAKPLFGGQTVGALIDPVGALGLGERVNIENHFPNWIGAAVAFKAGSPP